MSASKASSKAVTGEEGRRVRNRLLRSKYKTSLSNVEKLVASKELESARKGAIVAASNIDKAVKKKVIHKNKGANLKSQLDKKVNAALAGQESRKVPKEEGEGK
jgi:small subunit ribosomal protein S20